MTTAGNSITGGAEMRLATYGTLAPGRQNHSELSDLAGRWLVGHVCGSLVDAGWGAELGYPALVLDPEGPEIEVFVFESQALLHHWDRLDAFEGPGYRRVAVDVTTDEGVLPASIYVLAVGGGFAIEALPRAAAPGRPGRSRPRRKTLAAAARLPQAPCDSQ
jgi:gamma-glutamylcyclotransferase (GGCT)/AIG2-like uncharacterized protein YtfP